MALDISEAVFPDSPQSFLPAFRYSASLFTFPPERLINFRFNITTTQIYPFVQQNGGIRDFIGVEI